MTKRYRDPFLIFLLVYFFFTTLFQIAIKYLSGGISFTSIVVVVAADIAWAVVIMVLYVEVGNWIDTRVKPKLKEKLRLRK